MSIENIIGKTVSYRTNSQGDRNSSKVVRVEELQSVTGNRKITTLFLENGDEVDGISAFYSLSDVASPFCSYENLVESFKATYFSLKDKSLPDNPYEALAEAAKTLGAAIKMTHKYPEGADKRSFTGAVLTIDMIYKLQWLAHEAGRVSELSAVQSSS